MAEPGGKPDSTESIKFIRGNQTEPNQKAQSWDSTAGKEVHAGGGWNQDVIDPRLKREATLSLDKKNSAEQKQKDVFEKEVRSLEEAKSQYELWKSLVKRGISTYSFFKISERIDTNGKKRYFVHYDNLLKGDRFYVLSRNNILNRSLDNPDADHQVFGQMFLVNEFDKIPKQTKEQLKNEIRSIAESSSKPDENGKVIKLWEYTHPFLLIIDREDMSKAKVILGDLGTEDITQEDFTPDILDRNKQRAEKFIEEMRLQY